MKLNTKSRKKYPSEISDLIQKSLYKGVVSNIVDTVKDGDISKIYIETKSERIVGRFRFDIDGEECRLVEKHIIEADFYPLENAVFRMLGYLRGKKTSKVKVLMF